MPRPRSPISLVYDAEPTPNTPDLWHSDDERPVVPTNLHDAAKLFPRWMLELTGRSIQNRIRLGPVIGHGAFGVVYVGHGMRGLYNGNQSVAVKVLSTTALNSERRRQIEREILLHRRVAAHPNVISVYDILEDLSSLYIVMDACIEGDLFKCITEDELYVGNDSVVKEIFSQLLDAVEFCHGKGVYHRDLKPENILVRNSGTQVFLTDFGLATRDRVSKDFSYGSEFYMSPECIGYTGVESYSTSHNDIWALGIILINLITCRNPWKRAGMEDRAFRQFCMDPVGYMEATLPITQETTSLLTRILKPAPTLRLTIPQMRQDIVRVSQFLLSPLKAICVPEPAYEAAHGLYEIIASRRPQLLLDHYEDICQHYPAVAERLCQNLRLDLVNHRIINEPEDLFSRCQDVEDIRNELPEWAQPVIVEDQPESLEDIADYPQSPDMTRDDSAQTVVTNGPITPATHAVLVEDDVPEVVLNEVDQVGDQMDRLRVSDSAGRLDIPSSSTWSQVARVFGSVGGSWLKRGPMSPSLAATPRHS